MSSLHKQEMVRVFSTECTILSIWLLIFLCTKWPSVNLSMRQWFYLQSVCPFWEVYSHFSLTKILVLKHPIPFFPNSWASGNAHKSIFSAFSLSRDTGQLNALLELLSTAGEFLYLYLSGLLLSGGCNSTTVYFLRVSAYSGDICNSHKYFLHIQPSIRKYRGGHRCGMRELQTHDRSSHVGNITYLLLWLISAFWTCSRQVL